MTTTNLRDLMMKDVCSKDHRCYYEVLEIDRNADPDEIRKAYRRQALKCHPDKCDPSAKSLSETEFQRLKFAYSILSDQSVRELYDSRSRQLSTKKSKAPCQDDTIDIQPFFSRNCFTDFDDDESGFYSVFARLFARIHEQDEGSLEGLVGFGSSSSEFECIRNFYAHWSNYVCPRSFEWVNVYGRADPDEAFSAYCLMDRFSRRKIDNRNKKRQEQARKEWNGLVRDLVRKVQSLDPRYALLKKSRKKQKKRHECPKNRFQAKNDESYEEPDWAKTDELLDRIDSYWEGFSVNSEYAIECEDGIICAICVDGFKTSKAFERHLKSEKHLKLVEQCENRDEKEVTPGDNVDELKDLPEKEIGVDELKDLAEKGINVDESKNLPDKEIGVDESKDLPDKEINVDESKNLPDKEIGVDESKDLADKEIGVDESKDLPDKEINVDESKDLADKEIGVGESKDLPAKIGLEQSNVDQTKDTPKSKTKKQRRRRAIKPKADKIENDRSEVVEKPLNSSKPVSITEEPQVCQDPKNLNLSPISGLDYFMSVCAKGFLFIREITTRILGLLFPGREKGLEN